MTYKGKGSSHQFAVKYTKP